MGPNGVGKFTIAQNIAYKAVMQGHTALFVEVSGDDQQTILRMGRGLPECFLCSVGWRWNPRAHTELG